MAQNTANASVPVIRLSDLQRGGTPMGLPQMLPGMPQNSFNPGLMSAYGDMLDRVRALPTKKQDAALKIINASLSSLRVVLDAVWGVPKNVIKPPRGVTGAPSQADAQIYAEATAEEQNRAAAFKAIADSIEQALKDIASAIVSLM